MSAFTRFPIPRFLFTTTLLVFFLCNFIHFAAASTVPGPVPQPVGTRLGAAVARQRRRNNNNVQYSISKTQVSFEQLVQTGLVVTKGSSGVLNFDISLKAVQASTLASFDQDYQQCLSGAERREYRALKDAYKNQLDIPMFEHFGVHLNSTTLPSEGRRRRRQRRYQCKARAISEVFREQITTMIRISGTLRAEGVSIMPTTVYAFIRIARIETEDGSSMNVISSNPDDLAAANACGDEVPSSGLTLDIIDL